MIGKRILMIGITVVMIMSGCIGKRAANEDNLWLQMHGNEIIKYAYTKAEIESEIDAHWREYGYSEKPNKYIAISFDDGPCGISANDGTMAMVAKLEELHVKATFFVIGRHVRDRKAAASAIFNAGHEIGNHSYGYGPLGNENNENITASLDGASEIIKEITGKYPALFRAPNGIHGNNLSQVCLKRGMSLIDGTAHNDWDGTGHTPESIKNSVLANPQDGDIIVLHENNTSNGDTMKALPEIVIGLREKGLWIMSVGQLAAVKNQTLEAGKIYYTIK